MANSVDPDQTDPDGAVWSGSALFAYVILSDTLVFRILGHLTYLTEIFMVIYCVYPKYLGTSNPYHTCSKICTIYYMCLEIAGWVATV